MIKSKNVWIFTLINIILLSLYLISSKIIKFFNLEFMDWIHNIVLINIIVTPIMIINRLHTGKDYKYKKISIAVFVIISIFVSVVSIGIRFLTFTTEHIDYTSGKPIVITVKDALLNTYVTYYERKFFIFKKKLPREEHFEGSYDPFER